MKRKIFKHPIFPTKIWWWPCQRRRRKRRKRRRRRKRSKSLPLFSERL